MIGDYWKLTRFVELSRELDGILECNASWYTKHDIIFSAEVSTIVNDSIVGFSWYDPDTTEEEECLYFVRAIKEKAAEVQNVLDAINKAWEK